MMLKISDLTVIYPDKTKAITSLSFEIAAGENVALIGANGAGKTSLLLSMVGILPIALGTIEIDNILLSQKTLDEIRRRTGLVFQNPDDQLFMPDIFEDVKFGPRNFGLSEAHSAEKADATLKQLHIEHLKHRSPLKLSGGEKRTAAIATVLAMDPHILLLDEPTAYLDPKSRRNLIRLLADLPQTKLIATHDLTFAAETCGRVILMKDGALFADGSPEALLYDDKLMQDCGIEAIQGTRRIG